MKAFARSELSFNSPFLLLFCKQVCVIIGFCGRSQRPRLELWSHFVRFRGYTQGTNRCHVCHCPSFSCVCSESKSSWALYVHTSPFQSKLTEWLNALLLLNQKVAGESMHFSQLMVVKCPYVPGDSPVLSKALSGCSSGQVWLVKYLWKDFGRSDSSTPSLGRSLSQ